MARRERTTPRATHTQIVTDGRRLRDRRRWLSDSIKVHFLGSKLRIYVTMAGLCAAFGAVAFSVAEHSVIARVTLAVSESMLVALILAMAVDPYLKVTGFRETAEQISESFFWESVSPYCPIEYRERIKELAASRVFASSNLTTVHFEWATQKMAGILRVTITRESSLRNTSGTPYSPSNDFWVLGSTPRFDSEYLSWRLNSESEDFDETVEGDDLIPYLDRRQDGAVVLQETLLMNHFSHTPRIPPDGSFALQLKGQMYRRDRGYLPIVHGFPVAVGRLRCTGPALGDLMIRCMFAGIQLEREGEEHRPVYRQPRLAAPGEGFLLGWKTRDDS